jgi:hypothetical protein
MPERVFEDLFRSPDLARDNFLARLFGMFSEDVLRHWARDERAPYEDLGRPTLRSLTAPGFATLDFALRSRTEGRLYVAEQKAELAFEGYRYLRLTSSAQLEHHAKGRAFAWLLDVAHDPASHQVQIGGKPAEVSGAILVWGAVDAGGREDAMAKYGFADVLSLEDVLRDLRAWDAPEWRATVERYRLWANELFDGLM